MVKCRENEDHECVGRCANGCYVIGIIGMGMQELWWRDKVENTRTIKLEDQATWPYLGSTWKHRNGNRYVVVLYTNIESDRQDEYPTTIVYRNTVNGNRYSRRLVDWERSMTYE